MRIALSEDYKDLVMIVSKVYEHFSETWYINMNQKSRKT